jgi:hypothetical protein
MTLDAWMAEGELNDLKGEFLVVCDLNCADLEAPDFWPKAFTLRRTSGQSP